jgi:outer membrane immunogenic protein
MRNSKFFVSGVIAIGTIFGIGVASAADLAARPYTKAPPMVVDPVFNWTGFYIGAQVGGAWSEHRYDNIDLTGEPIGHNASSITGGGHLGYNWQFNSLVLGVEAEFNGTDLKGTSTSIFTPLVTYSTKVDWYGTVVGRLGYAFNRTMLYATGGVAFADIRSVGLNGPNGATDSFSNTTNRTGWTAGVGAAYQITANWIAGIDYKHIEFEKYNSTGITSTLLLPYTLTGIDTKIDQVTARISYKFGGPVVAKY